MRVGMDEAAFREIREIEVELTGACTRACAFCTPGLPAGRQDGIATLSNGRFADLVYELAALRYDGWLTFCGWGEPTLFNAFEECVVMAWRNLGRARFRLFTNGDLAEKVVRVLPFFDDVHVNLYELTGASENAFKRLVGRGKLPALRIDDHRGRCPSDYTTRAGNVRPYPPEYEVRLARRRHTPCEWFRTQLFLTAEGHWVTCCNDMKQIHTWEGGIADLFSDPDYLAMRRALADPAVDRRTLEPCSKCESA